MRHGKPWPEAAPRRRPRGPAGIGARGPRTARATPCTCRRSTRSAGTRPREAGHEVEDAGQRHPVPRDVLHRPALDAVEIGDLPDQAQVPQVAETPCARCGDQPVHREPPRRQDPRPGRWGRPKARASWHRSRRSRRRARSRPSRTRRQRASRGRPARSSAPSCKVSAPVMRSPPGARPLLPAPAAGVQEGREQGQRSSAPEPFEELPAGQGRVVLV